MSGLRLLGCPLRPEGVSSGAPSPRLLQKPHQAPPSEMSCAVEPVCAGGCLFLGPRGARGGSETFPRGSEGKAHCPRDLETEGWASNSLPEGLDPAALPDSALGSCQVNGAIGTAPSPAPRNDGFLHVFSVKQPQENEWCGLQFPVQKTRAPKSQLTCPQAAYKQLSEIPACLDPVALNIWKVLLPPN